MLRIYGAGARRERGAGREFEDVVGAVAERQPLERHAKARCQRFLEFEAVAVRVTPKLGGARDRSARGGRHAERIFVRCELDDRLRRQPEFACQFLDRLAALVWRDGSNVVVRPQRLLAGRHPCVSIGYEPRLLKNAHTSRSAASAVATRGSLSWP